MHPFPLTPVLHLEWSWPTLFQPFESNPGSLATLIVALVNGLVLVPVSNVSISNLEGVEFLIVIPSQELKG